MSDCESEAIEAPKKPKRVQSEAQKENFKKALAARAANVAARSETKDERIINKKLETLATKADKLKAKIPKKEPPPPPPSDDGDDESETEIVVIKKKAKPKKKRIVVVEPESESDDEPEEAIQKPKPRLPKAPPPPVVSPPHVKLPIFNMRFF